jgi:hypothetical protein
MARRDHLRQLVAFADIRAAQKQAADARLAEAQQVLGRQKRRLSFEEDAQADRGAAWAASLAEGRMDLTLALAWSHALLDGEASVSRAGRAVRRAEDRRDGARADSRAAEARRKAADTVAKGAARRVRRRADEAAIAEAEDRFAARRFR